MRKVKIPTSMNPFVVHVNGEKYVYPAGTEQEVTDAVANVIDAYIKKENQQPDPTEIPFSTSWNDLKDKPFGETTVKGDTLTWDGNTEGRMLLDDVADALGMPKICHISDEVITLEQLKNGVRYEVVHKMDTDPYILELSYEELAELQAGDIIVVEGNIFVAKDNVTMFGLTFPKAGIYMYWDDEEFAQASITIPGYNGFETTTIQPIETKYLPPLVSPSGKKFKLSVDDSGVLIATEV